MLNVPAALLLSTDRKRAYLLTSVSVATNLGTGQLVYATRDGYFGVRLAGETRVDEYPLTVCTVVS